MFLKGSALIHACEPQAVRPRVRTGMRYQHILPGRLRVSAHALAGTTNNYCKSNLQLPEWKLGTSSVSLCARWKLDESLGLSQGQQI